VALAGHNLIVNMVPEKWKDVSFR